MSDKREEKFVKDDYDNDHSNKDNEERERSGECWERIG